MLISVWHCFSFLVVLKSSKAYYNLEVHSHQFCWQQQIDRTNDGRTSYLDLHFYQVRQFVHAYKNRVFTYMHYCFMKYAYLKYKKMLIHTLMQKVLSFPMMNRDERWMNYCVSNKDRERRRLRMGLWAKRKITQDGFILE